MMAESAEGCLSEMRIKSEITGKDGHLCDLTYSDNHSHLDSIHKYFFHEKEGLKYCLMLNIIELI
jgi:hypothetical protein